MNNIPKDGACLNSPNFKLIANAFPSPVYLIELNTGVFSFANAQGIELLNLSDPLLPSTTIMDVCPNYSSLDTFQEAANQLPLTVNTIFHIKDKESIAVQLKFSSYNQEQMLLFVQEQSNSLRKIEQLETESEQLIEENKRLKQEQSIHEKRHQAISYIDSNVQQKIGIPYCKSIVQLLNKVLEAESTFVAQISWDCQTATTLYWYNNQGPIENTTYPLEGTPCWEVVSNTIAMYPCSIQEIFPEDTFLKVLDLTGYLGVPILDHNEEAIRFILVSLYKDEVEDPEEKIKLLKVFGSRIKNELIRAHLLNNLETQSSANEQLLNTEKILKEALAEKKILLKEIHHRVKNNLQVITGLLSLQSSFLNDEKTKEIFKYSQYRINAMAVVHEMLYQSNEISYINYGDYLEQLTTGLVKAMAPRHCNVQVNIQAPNIQLNIDTAIPLGLLVNEIITNALKYAFPNQTEGLIYLNLKALEHPHFQLEIGDNGIGMNPDLTPKTSDSLGLKLIQRLSIQLMGNLAYNYQKKGTHYLLSFQEIEQKS